MKHVLATVAFGTALLTGGAVAQMQAPSPRQNDAPIVHRSIKLTAEQGYIIRENVLKGSGTVGQVPSNSGVEIGDKAPANIELHDFPPLVTQRISAVKTYKYFIMDNKVVIVSPNDRMIADIIK